MASHTLEALVDAASQDKRKDAYGLPSSKSAGSHMMAPDESQLGTEHSKGAGGRPASAKDSLAELKRKFKDVLRAYWRQHKANHDGEDTETYEVAHRIATSIFNLYWDKPNYAGLRSDKKEILNYFIKHIQLSKSREGQSSNPMLRTHAASSASSKPDSRSLSSEADRIHYSTHEDSHLASLRKRSNDVVSTLPMRMDVDPTGKTRRDLSEPIKYLLPRSSDILRSIREIIPEMQLASSLLIDGVPAHIPDILVRNEIIQVLQAQFGVKCVVSAINIGSPLYHILLANPEECEALAGQNIKLSLSGFHMLYRAPFSPSSLATNAKKRRGGDLETDEVQRKKFKLTGGAEPSESAFHQTSAFVRPPMVTPAVGPTDDHYVVERILHQRWVQNKVQYLLQLKGEASSIKVWMFDEDIFAEADANRKQSNLWTACQTGVFPEASQLPEVEQILGAKMVGSQLMFYVKWTNSTIYALVPSTVINKAAPSKVIQFYEARLSFEPLPSTPMDITSPHVTSPSTSETSAGGSAPAKAAQPMAS